jgi:hypothetical protein
MRSNRSSFLKIHLAFIEFLWLEEQNLLRVLQVDFKQTVHTSIAQKAEGW